MQRLLGYYEYARFERKSKILELLPTCREIGLALRSGSFVRVFKAVWETAKIELLLVTVFDLWVLISTTSIYPGSPAGISGKIALLVVLAASLPYMTALLCGIEYAGGYLLTYLMDSSRQWKDIINTVQRKWGQVGIKALATFAIIAITSYILVATIELAKAATEPAPISLPVHIHMAIPYTPFFTDVIFAIDALLWGLLPLIILFLPFIGTIPLIISRRVARKYGNIAGILTAVVISTFLVLVTPATNLILFMAAAGAVLLGAIGLYTFTMRVFGRLLVLSAVGIMILKYYLDMTAMAQATHVGVSATEILIFALLIAAGLFLAKWENRKIDQALERCGNAIDREISGISSNMMLYAILFPIVSVILPHISISIRSAITYLISAPKSQGGAR